MNNLKKISEGRDLDKKLSASEALGKKIAGMFVGRTEKGMKNVLIDPVQTIDQRQKTENHNDRAEYGA
jgi:hypothetical protein